MMHLRTAAAIAIACLLWQCSTSSIAGGNSSDTGNVVAITAARDTIVVALQVQADVRVFSASYQPYYNIGYHDSVAADSGDTVRFAVPADGFYNVMVLDTNEGAGVFVNRIPVMPDTSFSFECDALPLNGAVTGTAANIDGDSVLYWAFVYIPGSPFWDYSASDGKFAFANIPAGMYELQFFGYTASEMYAAVSSKTPRILTEETSTVTVKEGETARWGR